MARRLDLPTRQMVHETTRRPEQQLVAELVAELLAERGHDETAVQQRAMSLAQGLRLRGPGSGRAGLVQSLLQEFALSSQEGVALMCLAEALLRIPDAATRDALIRDKIGQGNWQAHLGHSESIFVNAASWGLLVTGKLVATHSGQGLESALRRVLGLGGEPVVRKGLDMAMRLMGEQFVTGQTIGQALQHARSREPQGFRYSYDMLGEAALTQADALRYRQSYADAIEAIGAASAGRGVIRGPGISIKLSALHPRYTRWQMARVQEELYPALLDLAQRARAHDIGLNIDAEESERLALSLDLLERLCTEPALQGWQGLGFVVQAYQKRCPAVVEHLVALARKSGRRLMVRLVKGAYWDSEIKRAQAEGLSGFPVYTRKAHTDVSYLACARRLLAAPDAVFPQFATHNAHTVAAVMDMAQRMHGDWHEGQYEFQCLHGMGEPLYEQMVGAAVDSRPCRIYAPVGNHETLLAYLVRRLLENGANTSFVNRVANDGVALEALVEDPLRTVQHTAAAEGVLGAPHPAIALPRDLLGTQRRNSAGLDLYDEAVVAWWEGGWAQGMGAAAEQLLEQAAGPAPEDATEEEMQAALAQADTAFGPWADRSAQERAAVLDAAADLYETRMRPWLRLLADEAGKTAANGVAEVREAVDFLRYCAQQARECATLGHSRGWGPVLCISPWNFPLAIFTGQVAAALAAGNTVLAKPAEQTPRMAREAVQALWEAGVPRDVLHLLTGPGDTVGAALVRDPRVQAVVFTGSTEVAQQIQRQLAGRLTRDGQSVPLIAETGGQNAMVVDSSALLEQVTTDVLTSAFDSAGQRCSALRVLCVQDDAAQPLLRMVKGAMDELRVGSARELATDVGPVIDTAAQAEIEAHVARMHDRGCAVHRSAMAEPGSAQGRFVAPTLIEISHLGQLQREVFGPVLHVMRYAREELPHVLQQIRDTGYGLTLGVHSRIDETITRVLEAAAAGNIYVNRNMVGAVVGVQPFGGEGLSGTGPKAGGPLYLLRLMERHPAAAARHLVQASGVARPGPMRNPVPGLGAGGGVVVGAGPTLVAWLHGQGQGRMLLAREVQQSLDLAFTHDWRGLSGPTGESNDYAALPREAVLCLAETEDELLRQTGAALAVGARAVWTATHQSLHNRLPAAVAEAVTVAQDWRDQRTRFGAVLVHGSDSQVLSVAAAVAARPGPLLGVTRTGAAEFRQHAEGRAVAATTPIPLHRLVRERTVSVNTAAAGGNASLMTIG